MSATNGGDFARLHEVHLQLKQVRDQLDRGPKSIAARRKKVDVAKAELSAREAELKETRAAADRKGLELKTKETHLADLQGKLNAASSNREYDIIRGQMEADKAALAVLEDEILEYLERVDEGQRAIGEAQAALKQSEEDADKFAQDFEAKAESLRQQTAQLEAQLKEAEKIVPSQLMQNYRRMADAYGPDCLASAGDGVCNYCFTTLNSQQKVSLNSGNVIFCGSCGRLLYS